MAKSKSKSKTEKKPAAVATKGKSTRSSSSSKSHQNVISILDQVGGMPLDQGEITQFDGHCIFRKSRRKKIVQEDDRGLEDSLHSILNGGALEPSSSRGFTTRGTSHRPTITLRTTVQRQPRLSPPHAGLVKVVQGPYQGMSGFLSPTGTYGFSVLASNRGQFVTVQDCHVVSAAKFHSQRPQPQTSENETAHAKPPPEALLKKKAKSGSKEKTTNHSVPIQDYFLSKLGLAE